MELVPKQARWRALAWGLAWLVAKLSTDRVASRCEGCGAHVDAGASLASRLSASRGLLCCRHGTFREALGLHSSGRWRDHDLEDVDAVRCRARSRLKAVGMPAEDSA